MRALLASTLVALCGCGGLDNQPLRLGTIRGVVKGATASSLVSTEPTETVPLLTTKPDAEGRFELVGVPQGPVTLLVLANATSAERVMVNVQGGSIAELGAVGEAPAARVNLIVEPPLFFSYAKAKVRVGDLEMTQPLEPLGHEGLLRLGLPSGCYPTVVSIPGLGTITNQLCVEAPLLYRFEAEFPFPDGTPGHEGCSLSGCETGHACLSNGLCAF